MRVLNKLDFIEKRILNFVIDYKKEHGKPPTRNELANGTGLDHISLELNMQSLSKKGFIIFSSNVSRSIQILKLPEN